MNPQGFFGFLRSSLEFSGRSPIGPRERSETGTTNPLYDVDSKDGIQRFGNLRDGIRRTLPQWPLELTPSGCPVPSASRLELSVLTRFTYRCRLPIVVRTNGGRIESELAHRVVDK